MSFDHAMDCTAQIRKDVAVEQVQQALQPLFESFGYPDDTLVSRKVDLYSGHQFEFDSAAGELYVYTCGDVSSGFSDTLKEVASNLGPLVSKAGSLSLSNHDTADLENAVTEFFFGPSAEAIKAFRFDCCLGKAMGELKEFVGEKGVQALKATATAFAAGKMEPDDYLSELLSIAGIEVKPDPDQPGKYFWEGRDSASGTWATKAEARTDGLRNAVTYLLFRLDLTDDHWASLSDVRRLDIARSVYHPNDFDFKAAAIAAWDDNEGGEGMRRVIGRLREYGGVIVLGLENFLQFCEGVYERASVSGVEQLALAEGITGKIYCGPCEAEMPSLHDTCLCCGTSVPNEVVA